jgi:hypothetical protein
MFDFEMMSWNINDRWISVVNFWGKKIKDLLKTSMILKPLQIPSTRWKNPLNIIQQKINKKCRKKVIIIRYINCNCRYDSPFKQNNVEQ